MFRTYMLLVSLAICNSPYISNSQETPRVLNEESVNDNHILNATTVYCVCKIDKIYITNADIADMTKIMMFLFLNATIACDRTVEKFYSHMFHAVKTYGVTSKQSKCTKLMIKNYWDTIARQYGVQTENLFRSFDGLGITKMTRNLFAKIAITNSLHSNQLIQKISGTIMADKVSLPIIIEQFKYHCVDLNSKIIFIDIKNQTDSESRAIAYAIQNQLANGANFSKCALLYSDHKSWLNGGKLYHSIASSLFKPSSANQYTPYRTNGGYMIILYKNSDCTDTSVNSYQAAVAIARELTQDTIDAAVNNLSK
jgi:hypothetical protein